MARFRPLISWPYPDTKSRRSRYTFKASWSDTLSKLEHELDKLDARDVVIQADLTENEIRLDGFPRANARPGHPGIIVSFDSRHGPLQYATDTHEWWEHNVRAIALGLEALRAVDRYGITRTGEQYRGWRALPSASGGMTAREVLLHYAKIPPLEYIDATDDDFRAVYRAAIRNAHPDHGGTVEAVEAVRHAARQLGVLR